MGMKYVTLPYDLTWEALAWAKKHSPSYVTNDLHQDGYNHYDLYQIDYFFSDEQDAIWFKLRWT
jgi:hypothetical protein